MVEILPRGFSRNPLVILAACLAAGILAANFVDINLPATAVFSAICAVAAYFLREKYPATILVGLAFVSAGAMLLSVERQSVRADRIKVLYDGGAIASGSPVEIEGVLVSAPEPSTGGEFLTLGVEKIWVRGNEMRATGKVRVFVQMPLTVENEVPHSHLKYRSRLRIACRLEREDEFLNPGVLTRREILDRLDIDATGSVKSSLLIEHAADESVFLTLAWVYDQRSRLIEAFRQNLSPRAAGVMIASLLGNKYFLDKETGDLFRDGGTFHILVISGLHITFIGGLVLLFCRQLTRNRWLQFVVTVTILWAYTLAVGADVPVVRAAIMFTVLMFSYAIYRRGTLLNSLGLCALILLVWRPSDLFNPSFQLTFVSVAAIVGFAYPLLERLREVGSWTPTTTTPFPPNVSPWLKRLCETLYWSEDRWRFESNRQIWTAQFIKSPFLPRWGGSGVQKSARYLFEGLLVSLIVQVWMLPLSVVYFHRVSSASILLNLWVGLLIALESFAAVAGAVALNVSSLLAAAFFFSAEIFDQIMLSVPRLFSDGGWASFRLPAYTEEGRAVYILYFIPILLLTIFVHRWKPFALKPALMRYRRILTGTLGALTLFLLAIVFHPFSATYPDGRLHVDFLDVGQGDSALVTFPDGKTLLVDGGGQMRFKRAEDDAETFEPDVHTIGESVVSEVLWAKGLSRIDHILATHADVDHIQGLTDVAKNFEIGSAIFGRTPPQDTDFGELAEILRRQRVPIETVSRGETLQFGDVHVEVLHPVRRDDPDAVSDNDQSVVLRIVFGSRRILFTGDIEKAAEATLADGATVLEADVAKIPHHGSRTSSTQPFIEAVRPTHSIISVGRSSHFGHPHAEVVNRLITAGSKVLTTGKSGMISVSTDGRDLIIETFMSEQ